MTQLSDSLTCQVSAKERKDDMAGRGGEGSQGKARKLFAWLSWADPIASRTWESPQLSGVVDPSTACP